MKTVPVDLLAHLAGDATTTCQCWRVSRRDGRVFGFTEHDHDLGFDGTLFLAASGFSASETEAATGLAASGSEVTGGFSGDSILEADLAAGRFDGARVEVFLVNWRQPGQYLLQTVREIGEVSRDGSRFRAELRSLAHRLGQPQGRIYNRRCDAVLGDARCGVDLTGGGLAGGGLAGGGFAGSGQVVAVIDAARVEVSGLEGFADGFFRFGRLVFSNGGLDGTGVDVESQTVLAEGVSKLGFWLPMERLPQVGDGFVITAGCDKAFSTCAAKFDNILNFRGCPHMPGADFAYSYVDGETAHDGRPLFS
jgi:uncharacterized phage protein (TIGR02218 family)